MLRKEVLKPFEEQKEYMEEKIAHGIEAYRKGNAKITVRSSDGKAISNISVKIEQISHAFRFGANLFMLDELESPQKNELYKKYFCEIFNMATLPFYWNTVEPERGKTRYGKDSPRIYRRPAIDLCIDFCEKNGIEPREHALAYEHFFPDWLSECSVEEIKKEYERRCREISERYSNRIPTVEVTNEMDWAEGKTAFYDSPDFIEWCFKTAEKYFSKNKLVINERTGLSWEDKCRYTDKYYSYIESAMLKGARIDAIGMQYHMFIPKERESEETKHYYSPENLYAHMDLYSTLGKPLQITEITVPSYSWESEDEEIQAQIIEYLYSIWFSHPAVEQIIYWNLIDGYAHVWENDPKKIQASQGNMTLGENYYHGGLLRFDLTPKPAYFKIKELLKKKWHTEQKLTTNADGHASFRGFYGKYKVEITTNGSTITKEISVDKNSENSFEIII